MRALFSMRQLAKLNVLFVFVIAALAHTYFFHLTEIISLQGFSVLEYLEHMTHPENFARDFPGGSYATGVSILTYLYFPAQKLLGLSGMTLLTFMIFVEIICVMAAAWVLWRLLVEDKPQNNAELWMYGWLCAILVASQITTPNLASFGYPFFHGQFYGFADALRIVAIVFSIRRRWGLVALSLGVGFMIHPIKIFFGAVFILTVALVDWRQTLRVKPLLWGSACAVFCAWWGYFWLSMGNVSDAPLISADDFIAYTRIFQSHWYPFDIGVLTSQQASTLSPFLGLILMAMLALVQCGLPARISWQIATGFFVMGILTAAGVYISGEVDSPTLIKLCLLRASELMTLLAPFLLLAALYRKYQARQWHWVALYVVFMIGGWLAPAYLSPGFAVVAVGLYYYEERKHRTLFIGNGGGFDLFLAFAAVVAIIIILSIYRVYPMWGNPFLLAWWRLVYFAAVLLVLRAVRNRYFPHIDNVRLLAMTLSISLLAIQWARETHVKDAAYLTQADAFLAAQLWAREHTKPTDLFMVDPCIIYGWRDFSARSSLGTPREWYMTGWLYISDSRVFEKGKAIGKALGLDMKKQLAGRYAPIKTYSPHVCAEAQNLFYDPSQQGIKRLTREFGVNYFVMLKERAKAIPQVVAARPVFQNDYYTVYAAKDLNP